MAASSSPYRAQVDPRTPNRRRRTEGDREVLVALGLFWLVCLVRVVGGALRHEMFGTEGTLAVLGAVGVPWIVLRRPAPSPRDG